MGLEQLSKHELTLKPVTIDEWADLQSLFAEPGALVEVSGKEWRPDKSLELQC